MNILLKLIYREAWEHRSRISLAVIATAAMSAMLVWLISSINLVIMQYENDGEHYLGHYSVAVTPPAAGRNPFAPPAAETTPPPSPPPRVNMEDVAETIKADPLVLEITPARQIRNTMAKWTGEDSILERQRSGLGIPMGSPVIIGIDAKESPFELKEGKWFNPDAAELEGVMGTGAAKSLSGWGRESDTVKVGDYVGVRIGQITAGQKEYKIKVTGLVEQKLGGGFGGGPGGGGITPAVGALYVSMKTADLLSPVSPAPPGNASVDTAPDTAPAPATSPNSRTYYYVRLKEGVKISEWVERCKNNGNEALAAVQYITADDIQKKFDEQQGGRSAGGLVGSAGSKNAIILFSTLVSILIVFGALSMGVNERARTFARLRTVGMPRSGIAVLVFGESFVLSVFGWAGGILTGWIVLQLSAEYMTGVQNSKWVTLNAASLIMSAVAAFAGALLAAIIPAWRGSGVQPLEGMNRGGFALTPRLCKGIIFAAAAGLLLSAVNPFICYYEPLPVSGIMRQRLYSFIGLPAQLIGLLLFVPAVVLLTEKLFTGIIAALLSVPKALLKNQLSANLWRTVGTAVALSIGLGVYSFLEISGYSMLVPFTHSDRLPDSLAAFMPKGIPFEEVDKVRHLDGVDAERFLTIALEQPGFSQEQSEQFLNNGMSPMQANGGIVVFGLDAEDAFRPRTGGKNSGKPFVDVDFVEGTLKDAAAKLKTGGRYCILPDSFAFRANLHIGDKLQLVPHTEGLPGGGRGTGGRRRGGRSLPDGSLPDGQRGEGRPPVNVDGKPPWGDGPPPWANGEGGRFAGRPVRQEPVEYEVAGVVSVPGWLWMAKLSGIRKYGMRSGAMMFAPFETVKNDFRVRDAAYFWFDRTLDKRGKPVVSDDVLEKNLQTLADKNAGGSGGGDGSVQNRPMVKLSSHEYLNERVGSRADQVIQAAARMPLILLAISSFAMMGTIAASIRVRRFEFGVLRSLGITRWGLIRLILAEALLISMTAVALSVAFGILGGWCFIGLMKYVSFFGGFTNPLTVPWYYLSIGIDVAVLLCSLAAVFPAAAAGRKEPTILLRAG